MASPGGKSVGRTSIRVVPDSSRFREDLRKALERIERTEFVHLRPALLERDVVRFHRDVQKLARDASGNKVNVAVAANTAAAAAQLRYTARPRIVPLHVRVSQRSLTTAATAIAALSGARVAASWVEDLSRSLGNIDKNLPKIGFVTTAIASLSSVLFASLSGIVGIGAGLAAILPALLVLPGLFVGLVTSSALLAVALAESGTQLASLAPHMRELTGIIREGFWSQARQPILDLVNNLMPQLRSSFRETSIAIGGFIGGMATSFDKEFANGRFESIFAGMTRSFEILRTGTDGFAGALVSLFQVAADYVPRLSQWFVDLANRFDGWLKATAEDGRVSGWIEGAIVAMNDLWRATAATGSALAGLWRAAEAAGGGGLGGFADNMERIAAVVNGPAFQRGMTAIFAGAQTATAGLNVALRALGGLLDEQRVAVEFFLGQTGIIFGRFFADIFDALNTPEISRGLTDFVNGLRIGFRDFGSYLPQVAQGLASLGSFAGALARELGPVLGATLAAVALVLDELLTSLQPLLPALGEAMVKAITDLTPLLVDLAVSLGPLLVDAVNAAVLIIPELIRIIQMLWPVIQGTVDAVVGLIGWLLTPTREAFGNFADLVAGLGPVGQLFAFILRGMGDFLGGGLSGMVRNIQQFLTDAVTLVTGLDGRLRDAFLGAGRWLYDAGRNIIQGLIDGIVSLISRVSTIAASVGTAAAAAIRKALGIASPSKVAHKLGRFVTDGFAGGMQAGKVDVAAAGRTVGEIAASSISIPDFSVLGPALGGGGSSTSWSLNFPVTPEPGIPLADQVFYAARRLRARVAG